MLDVLVPVYNAKRFCSRLHDQIDPLIRQGTNVIIYDDGSTDSGADLLEKMGYSVIRGLINRGPGAARNRLAEYSKAEWIHFHDADDEISPTYFEAVQPILRDETDIIFHNVEFVDEVSRKPIITFFAEAGMERDPIGTLLQKPMGTTSSTIRRSVFLGVGGFNEVHRCFEDGDLHFRVALSGAKVKAIPVTLETSLRHSDGASANSHYCYKCRLAFLESYVESIPEQYLQTLSGEFFKTASSLARCGDLKSAKRSLDRYRNLGGQFPFTQNWFLKQAGRVLPDMIILKMQVEAQRLGKALRD